MKAKWEEFEFTEFIEPFKSAAFISKIFTSFVVFNESSLIFDLKLINEIFCSIFLKLFCV